MISLDNYFKNIGWLGFLDARHRLRKVLARALRESGGERRISSNLLGGL